MRCTRDRYLTLLLTFRSQPMWLDEEDVVSMAGGAPRSLPAIDTYTWGRAALEFVQIGHDEHEALANKIGVGGAGEVVLLAVARKCGDNPLLWSEARLLGIPWLQKRWSSLSQLEQDYHRGVEKYDNLASVEEEPDAVLSGSSPRAPSLAGGLSSPLTPIRSRGGASNASQSWLDFLLRKR